MDLVFYYIYNFLEPKNSTQMHFFGRLPSSGGGSTIRAGKYAQCFNFAQTISLKITEFLSMLEIVSIERNFIYFK